MFLTNQNVKDSKFMHWSSTRWRCWLSPCYSTASARLWPQAQTLPFLWRWHAYAGEHLHGCASIPSERRCVVWCFVAALQQASTLQRLWAKNITSIGQPAPPACAQLHAHYASNQQTLRPLHSTTELYAQHGYQKGKASVWAQRRETPEEISHTW